MVLPVDAIPTPDGAPDPSTISDALTVAGTSLPPMGIAEIAALAVEVMAGEHDDDDTSMLPEPVWGDRWTITSTGAAEWAMRHLANAQEQKAQRQAERDEFVRQIDVWLSAEVRPLETTAAFMRAHLERWGLGQRAEDGKATRPLPSGVVRTTAHQTAVTLPKGGEDGKAARQAIVEWAIQHEHTEVINPDVYVQALRTLVRPVRRLTLTLACGHPQETMTLDYDEWTPGLSPVGSMFWCTVGHHESAVMDVEVVEAVIDTETGQPVPGAVIDPAHLTVTVSPK